MKLSYSNMAFISLMALITGCLGGKSSDSSSSSSSGYAQFIDAPVEGVIVKRLASGAEVTTDTDGRFDCEPNEILSFNVGGLELGQAACNSQVFVTDFGEGRWQKAAKILQCLSSTDPNQGKLKVSHVGSTDLASINLDDDDENVLDTKLEDHKRRDVSLSNAEGHALGHLLDRVQYNPLFEALFTSSTLTKSVKAIRTKTEGSGAQRCPQYYNIKFELSQISKEINAETKFFYTAQLSKVAGYNADEAKDGDDCQAIGIEVGDDCRNWTVADPEMKERPTIHGDEFKIVRFKNSFAPGTTGVKKLKIKGEIEVAGTDFNLKGDWKEEFRIAQSGSTSEGECEYEFGEDD
jgi:hypothetical protein